MVLADRSWKPIMPSGNICPPFLEAIKAALEQRGNISDPNATAEATAAIWRLMEAQLVPVIGTRGVDVLFRRALHQTTPGFPWLAVATDRGGSASPLPSLMACLATQAGIPARKAAHSLLLNFAELLTTLIGESLTERLLAPVWAGPSRPLGQEQHHE